MTKRSCKSCKLGLVSFARYNNLLVENHEIFIPHLYLSPPQGWPCRNFVKMFDADKNTIIGLPYGEKNYDDMFSRFYLIPERYPYRASAY